MKTRHGGDVAPGGNGPALASLTLGLMALLSFGILLFYPILGRGLVVPSGFGTWFADGVILLSLVGIMLSFLATVFGIIGVVRSRKRGGQTIAVASLMLGVIVMLALIGMVLWTAGRIDLE